LGPDLFGALVMVIEEIQEALGLGVAAYAQAKVAQLWQFLTQDLPAALAAMVGQMATAAVQSVIGAGVRRAVEYLVSLLNPAGAVYQLLKAAYNAVRWLIANRDRLVRLFLAVTDAFHVAASRQAAAIVASRVVNVLRSGVVPLIDGLAKFAGVDDLPRIIREALAQLKCIAQTPVRLVLEKLGALMQRAWQAILGGLGLGDGGVNPVVQPDRIDWEGYHRLWSEPDGTVMVGGSPSEALLPKLRAMIGGGDSRDCLQRASDLVPGVSSAGTDLVMASKGVRRAAQLGTVPPLKRVAAQKQADLADALRGCSPAPQNACAIGRPGITAPAWNTRASTGPLTQGILMGNQAAPSDACTGLVVGVAVHSLGLVDSK